MRFGVHVFLLAVALLIGAATASSASAQSDIRREILNSQRRLEQIRAERARLEQEITGVRNSVRSSASELANVERRLSASRSVLAEIQFQSDATTEQVQNTTVELVQSRERLAENKAVLYRRLRDIYKMGPLNT